MRTDPLERLTDACLLFILIAVVLGLVSILPADAAQVTLTTSLEGKTYQAWDGSWYSFTPENMSNVSRWAYHIYSGNEDEYNLSRWNISSNNYNYIALENKSYMTYVFGFDKVNVNMKFVTLADLLDNFVLEGDERYLMVNNTCTFCGAYFNESINMGEFERITFFRATNSTGEELPVNITVTYINESSRQIKLRFNNTGLMGVSRPLYINESSITIFLANASGNTGKKTLTTEFTTATGYTITFTDFFVPTTDLTATELDNLSANDANYVWMNGSSSRGTGIYVNFTVPNVLSVNYANATWVTYISASDQGRHGFYRPAYSYWKSLRNTTVLAAEYTSVYNISSEADKADYISIDANYNMNISMMFWTAGSTLSNAYGDIFNMTVNYELYVPPSSYMPPTPINIANTSGYYFVNTTVEVGSGNVTDIFNKTIKNNSDDTTYQNDSYPYYNGTSLSNHTSVNVSFKAFNSTSGGSLNNTDTWMNTTIPNRAITISNISSYYALTDGDLLQIRPTYTDEDLDVPTFTRNFTNGSFESDSGNLTWYVNYNATNYSWSICGEDGWGSQSCINFTVNVTDTHTPTTPGNFRNTSAPTHQSVTVEWDASNDGANGSGINRYSIERTNESIYYLSVQRESITASGMTTGYESDAYWYTFKSNSPVVCIDCHSGGIPKNQTNRTGSVLVKFNNTYFYSIVHAPDNDTAADDDIARFIFDTGNNGSNDILPQVDDKMFDVNESGTVTAFVGDGTGWITTSTNSVIAVTGASGKAPRYEIRIPLTEIGSPTNGTIMRFLFENTCENGTDFVLRHAYLPQGGNETMPYTWNLTVTFRNQVDYITVVNTTGTLYTLTDLNNSWRYNFTVKAVDNVGLTSSKSNNLTVQTNDWLGYNVSGYVLNYLGGGVPGAHVRMWDYVVETNETGGYVFVEILNGTKNVTATTSNTSFSSNTIAVTVNGADKVGQNLTIPHITGNASNLQNTIAGLTLNYTWTAGGNTTSFNVMFNGVWTNKTPYNYSNNTLPAHGYGNITVLGFNNYTNASSQGSIWQNTTLPNQLVYILNATNKTADENQNVFVDFDCFDADEDTCIFYINQSNFTDFNSATGKGNWSTNYSAAGVYSVNATVQDGWGSQDTYIFTVTINNVPLTITDSDPPSDFSTDVGEPVEFYTVTNRTANVTWFINDSQVQFNESLVMANYSNSTAGVGVWIVKAQAVNAPDNVSQTWNWTVQEAGGGAVTGYSICANGCNATWSGNSTLDNITQNQGTRFLELKEVLSNFSSRWRCDSNFTDDNRTTAGDGSVLGAPAMNPTNCDYDGTDDAHVVAHKGVYNYSTQGTIYTQVRVDSAKAWQQIIGKRGGGGTAADFTYMLDFGAGGNTPRGIISDGSNLDIITGSALTAGTVYDVVFSWNGTYLNMWINGTKQTPVAQARNAWLKTFDFQIARTATAAPVYSDITIYDLRIYPYGISDSEITNLNKTKTQGNVTTWYDAGELYVVSQMGINMTTPTTTNYTDTTYNNDTSAFLEEWTVQTGNQSFALTNKVSDIKSNTSMFGDGNGNRTPEFMKITFYTQVNGNLPNITSHSNNLTNNDTLSFRTNLSTGVLVNATSNQTIESWSCDGGTNISGNNTIAGSCSQFYGVSGTYYLNMSGLNINGRTQWINKTIQVNSPPTITNISSNYYINETEPISVDADCTDPDGDSCTFTRNFLAGTLTSSTGLWEWTTTNGDYGNYTFNITANDGHGGTSTKTFTVFVNSTTIYNSTNFTYGEGGASYYNNVSYGNTTIRYRRPCCAITLDMPGVDNFDSYPENTDIGNQYRWITSGTDANNYVRAITDYNDSTNKVLKYVESGDGTNTNFYYEAPSGIGGNTVEWDIEVNTSHINGAQYFYIYNLSAYVNTQIYMLSSDTSVKYWSGASWENFPTPVTYSDNVRYNYKIVHISNTQYEFFVDNISKGTVNYYVNNTDGKFKRFYVEAGATAWSRTVYYDNFKLYDSGTPFYSEGNATLNYSYVGTLISQIDVNTSTVSNNNWTMAYRQKGIGSYQQIGDVHTGNFSQLLSPRYSEVDVRITIYGDRYDTLNVTRVTFYTLSGGTPNITSWGNTKTNNNSLSIIVNTSETVSFNATANQSIATWHWYKDNVTINNNFDTYTTFWSTPGTKSIIVNASSAMATSSSVTWIINVVEQPANNSWQSSSFRQKLPIYINHSVLEDISSYYQANTTLNGILYNLSGLRIFDGDNATEFNFWNETALTTATKTWMNVSGIDVNSNKTIWAYINSTDNTNHSNGAGTFELFDDFTEPSTSIADNGVNAPTLGVMIYPNTYHHNNKTYFAWEGGTANMDAYVTAYNHTTNSLDNIVYVGAGQNLNDNHGQGALTVTDDGYVHYVYGASASCAVQQIKHYKSTSTENISSWAVQADMGDYCFPQLLKIANGTIYFIYTRSPSSHHKIYIRSSTDNMSTWSNETFLIDMDTLITYHGNYAYDQVNGRIHFGWTVEEADGSRTSIYHAYYNLTDGNMYGMNGTNYGVPTTVGLIYNSGSTHVDAPGLHLDSNGYPHLMFSHAKFGGWDTYYSYWNSTAWTTQLAVSDTGSQYTYPDFKVYNATNISAYLIGSTESTVGLRKWNYNGTGWTPVTIYGSSSMIDYGSGTSQAVVPYGNGDVELTFVQEFGDWVGNKNKIFAYRNGELIRRNTPELNLTKWARRMSGYGYQYEMIDGKLRVTGNASSYYRLISSRNLLPTGKVLEISGNLTESDYSFIGLCDLNEAGTTTGTGEDCAGFVYNSSQGGKVYLTSREGTNTTATRTNDLSVDMPTLRIEFTSNYVKFYENGTLNASITTNIPVDDIGVVFKVKGASSAIYIDNVRIRRYVSIEPQIVVGAVHWGGDTKPSMNSSNLIGINGLIDYGETYPSYKANLTITPLNKIINATMNVYNSTLINFTVINFTSNEIMNVTVYNDTFTIQNGQNYSINKNGIEQQIITASSNTAIFTNIAVGSDYTVQEESDSTPPASITNNQTTTWNFGINNTWTNPVDADFNNTWWRNTTTGESLGNMSNTTWNRTLLAHYTQNISAQTVDTSGNKNETRIWFNTTIPNNAINITNATNKTANENTTIFIDLNHEDVDSDPGTYTVNQSNFTDFNSAAGTGSWLANYSAAGTYYVNACADDGWGSQSCYVFTITINDVPLTIVGYQPATPLSSTAGQAQAFNITLSRFVNVTWFINNSQVQFNESLIMANYTNSTAGAGVWIVKAQAVSTPDNVSQTWTWTVNALPGNPPNTTAYWNSINFWNQTAMSINAGNSATFNVTVNQSVTAVSWKVEGGEEQNTSSLQFIRAFNTLGNFNVTAQAFNANGSSQIVYTVVTVTESGGGGTNWDYLTGYVKDDGGSPVNLAWVNTSEGNTQTNGAGYYSFGYVFVDGDTYWINGSKSGYTANNTQLTFNEDHEILNITLTGISINAPNITSWSNSNTTNNTLTFTVQKYVNVTFNVTANQSLDTCTWTGATAINCTSVSYAYKNFTSSGVNQVIFQGSNANGSTQAITWTVTVLGAGYTVSGYVTNILTVPVVNARIDLNNTFALTDSNGYYTLTDIDDGSYSVLARGIGYRNNTNTIEIDSDTIVNFTLSEKTVGSVSASGFEGIGIFILLIIIYIVRKHGQ